MAPRSGEVTPVPERGDVLWLTASTVAGHEQAGRRPWLVVSPGSYNGTVGLALLCPVTSKAKGYPFEVVLPEGLPVAGVVLSDQVKSLDWRARRAERACALPNEVIEAVLGRLATLVG
jgi:mRNA interferase MazF